METKRLEEYKTLQNRLAEKSTSYPEKNRLREFTGYRKNVGIIHNDYSLMRGWVSEAIRMLCINKEPVKLAEMCDAVEKKVGDAKLTEHIVVTTIAELHTALAAPWYIEGNAFRTVRRSNMQLCSVEDMPPNLPLELLREIQKNECVPKEFRVIASSNLKTAIQHPQHWMVLLGLYERHGFDVDAMREYHRPSRLEVHCSEKVSTLIQDAFHSEESGFCTYSRDYGALITKGQKGGRDSKTILLTHDDEVYLKHLHDLGTQDEQAYSATEEKISNANTTFTTRLNAYLSHQLSP